MLFLLRNVAILFHKFLMARIQYHISHYGILDNLISKKSACLIYFSVDGVVSFVELYLLKRNCTISNKFLFKDTIKEMRFTNK